jgi:hypothetical protein
MSLMCAPSPTPLHQQHSQDPHIHSVKDEAGAGHMSQKRPAPSPVRFLVLGDSHTEVFTWLNRATNTSTFEVCMIAGATAAGLTSINSKSQARNILLDKVRAIYVQ